MKQQPECPECDKMLKVKDDSHKLGEFLEWLQSQGYELAKPHEHTDACGETEYDDYSHDCGYFLGQLVATRETIETLLAKYFQIDLKKVEEEKRALLASLQE